MARIRNIKPELAKHGDLFDLEKSSGLPIRFAWAMLWTQCDIEGRFRWKPRELKLEILPYDDVDIEDVLDALTSGGFVVPYEVDGKKYGYVPNFSKHQRFSTGEKNDGPEHPEPPTPSKPKSPTSRRGGKSKADPGQTQVRPESDLGQTEINPEAEEGQPQKSLTTDNRQLTTDNRQLTTDERERSAPAASTLAVARGSPTPKDCLAAWDARWLKVHGQPYVRTNEKAEAAQAAALLKKSAMAGLSPPEIGEAMARCLRDPFWAAKGFLTFVSHFAEFSVEKRKRSGDYEKFGPDDPLFKGLTDGDNHGNGGRLGLPA